MSDFAKRNALLTVLSLLAALIVVLGGLLTGAIDLPVLQQNLTPTKHPAEDTDLLYTQARMSYEKGDRPMAAALARRITYLNDRHVGARKLLAALALRDNDFKTAEKECQKALSVDPTDLTAWAGLGKALRGQGRREEAMNVYRGILKAAPKDDNFRYRDEALVNLQELEREMKELDPNYKGEPLPVPIPQGTPDPMADLLSGAKQIESVESAPSPAPTPLMPLTPPAGSIPTP